VLFDGIGSSPQATSEEENETKDRNR
jgi:hypothetical protein